MGEGREDLHARQRRLDEAAVARSTQQHPPLDAQPLPAAHRRERDDAAGSARGRPGGGRHRRPLRDQRRQWSGALAPKVREPAHESGARRQRALPWRTDRRAGDGAGVAGQVHGLRRVVGWQAAPDQSRRRRERRAAGEVHSRQRQAVRAQLQGRRHLHRNRAGLRRSDERLPLVRPRVAPCEHVHSGRRRAVGAPRRGDRCRRPRLPRNRRRALRPGEPSPRQRHRRREARREQDAAARRLLRRAERELAVPPRPRREHDAGGDRLPRPEVPRRHEQGVPSVAPGPREPRWRGSSHHASHDAAHLCRLAGVRQRRRVGRARAPGRIRRARSGCSCRSGAP